MHSMSNLLKRYFLLVNSMFWCFCWGISMRTYASVYARDLDSYQKKSKWCHESFFGEFPCATILFLINLLKTAEVYIQDASIDDAESNRTKKGFVSTLVLFAKNTDVWGKTMKNTYMAIPKNPFNGATPHITPRITAIIWRSQ